jgi:hypothetical protein
MRDKITEGFPKRLETGRTQGKTLFVPIVAIVDRLVTRKRDAPLLNASTVIGASCRRWRLPGNFCRLAGKSHRTF